MSERTVPEERFLEVPRTARYYVAGTATPALREAWLVCHGYGQLAASFVRAFVPIADASRIVVAPEALNRYYPEVDAGPHGPESPVAATWMTREDRLHEIADYVRYLDLVHAGAFNDVGDDAIIVALGFSQGAATVARWAAHTRRRIDHVILWGAGLPPELEPTPTLFGTAGLTIAVGEQDRFLGEEGIRREEERLRAGGLAFELFRYEGGHRIDADALGRLAASLTARQPR